MGRLLVFVVAPHCVFIASVLHATNKSNLSISVQVQPNRATAKKITLDIDGSGPLRPFEVDCRFTTDEQVGERKPEHMIFTGSFRR